MMKITILDGYIDEPSRLGVPPFISPYARYLFGAVKAAGHEPEYMTIDHYRQGRRPVGDLLFMVSGALVPGKYLRTMPMSSKELASILVESQVENYVWYSSKPEMTPPGATHIWDCDADAYLFDMLINDSPDKRRRTPQEWSEWPVLGADMVKHHHDFPQPLIAEIDMSYGCPHYVTGGCSFCTEPLFGMPVFREQDSIIAEMKALLKAGCVNFRLGGQSCVLSYKAIGVGDTDRPKPNIAALGELFKGISKISGFKVLHTDNADPSIIASHPDESEKVLQIIAQTCTSGNLLSMGIESADPLVIDMNNLNSQPADVMVAIKLINKVGRKRGPTGLPVLLPGLNFLAGLEGETKETFELNSQFLKDVLSQDLLLRRINIRQVAPTRKEYPPTRLKKQFIAFKKFVREDIDRPMLEKVFPAGTLLKNLYTEVKIGKIMFARQIGTYPILVGLPQSLEPGIFLDAKITTHGSRSLTALEYPLDINNCQLSALEELPGIGRKRATRLFHARPINSEDELINALDDPALVSQIMPFLAF